MGADQVTRNEGQNGSRVGLVMAEEKAKLMRLVNSSGFPFQLRVADQIRRLDPICGCELLLQEHPWRAEDGREGFIDIVIRNSEADRMVPECKRTRDAEWIFLVPKGGMSNWGKQARMLYVSIPWKTLPDQSLRSHRTSLSITRGWTDPGWGI
jgi:hypothetical protein